ncbi:MAG: hypothetical protein IPM69_19955 [Ignavibacteria bacterium]|nr:hypothetical protein [Ignavibacteria bacterium]
MFCTYNGGVSWLPLGVGFPTTSVMDMQFYMGNPVEPNTIILRVSTHGRSMWEVDVPNEAITVVGADELPFSKETIFLTADIYPNPVSATSYISFALRSSDCNVKIE